MTSLISWIGIDSRGPASIYFASDSRISYKVKDSRISKSYKIQWDSGKKLFASKCYPLILAYCGDVDFPIQVLSRIIEGIDNNLLISENDEQDLKEEKIFTSIRDSFENYPKIKRKDFYIICANRQNNGMKSVFHVFKIIWNSLNECRKIKLTIPKESGLIESIGSGSQSVNKWYVKWQSSDSARTSRSVFSAFCDSLASQEDEDSGGTPQLVGIYRNMTARTFGIIYDNERYYYGERIENTDNLNNIEWMNNLFERCDGKTMKILEKAQRQPRPKNIK